MVEIIQKLWNQERLPIIGGLYKSNGFYYELIENQVVTADLPRKEYADWYSNICIHAEMEYQGVKYCCGEGSWGSDGYGLYVSRPSIHFYIVFLRNTNYAAPSPMAIQMVCGLS